MDDVHDNLGVGPTFQATRRFAWVETRRVRADGAIASYETDEGSRGKAGPFPMCDMWGANKAR